MAKLVLAEIQVGMGSTDLLNSNFQAIADALDNTVSRDGALPNQMEADLDLNGHNLLNTGDSDDPNRVLTFQDMVDFVSDQAGGVVVQKQEIQTATSGQTIFNLATMTYAVGSNNLAVYVDGIRKFAPIDYSEASPSQVVFLAGITLGAKVEFVTNEFLGNVNLPSHTHPWSQIINPPVFTTRWPDWTEVTGKPAVFPPEAHTHAAGDISSGRLADPRRGVFVQASQPAGAGAGDLWFW